MVGVVVKAVVVVPIVEAVVIAGLASQILSLGGGDGGTGGGGGGGGGDKDLVWVVEDKSGLTTNTEALSMGAERLVVSTGGRRVEASMVVVAVVVGMAGGGYEGRADTGPSSPGPAWKVMVHTASPSPMLGLDGRRERAGGRMPVEGHCTRTVPLLGESFSGGGGGGGSCTRHWGAAWGARSSGGGIRLAFGAMRDGAAPWRASRCWQ